jgi:O-antigen/teichoic acid export membrane protein
MSQTLTIPRGAAEDRTTLQVRTLSGIGWGAAGRVGQQALGFITSVLLARLLLPEDFGLLAIATVFSGFAATLVDAGLGEALIQRKVLDDAHLNSVFFLSIAIGLLAAMVFWFAAPALASLYAAPILEPVCRVLALGLILGALGTVPRALRRRRMELRVLAAVDVVATCLGGIVAVSLAASGAGVWSLLASSLLGTAVAAAILWAGCPWRPRAEFHGEACREVMRFSGGLVGFNMVNYWARNLDNLLIGWMLGAAALGVYARAYFLMLLPIYQVTSVIATAMLPALASIQEDRPRVKAVYLRSLGAIGLISAPAVIGLFVVADTLIPVLYGANWRGVVPVFRILCVASLLQAFCNPVGWIYTTQNRTDLMFRWGLFGSGVQVLAIGLGGCGGTLSSIAVAYVIACVAILYPCLAIPGRLIGLTFREIVSTIVGAIVCSFVMGLLVYQVGRLLVGHSMWTILAVQIAAGIFSYWAMIHVLRLRAYTDLLSILFPRRGFT